jgi:hypothetical protein
VGPELLADALSSSLDSILGVVFIGVKREEKNRIDKGSIL